MKRDHPSGFWTSGWSSTSLPPDLVANSCRRIAAVALAGAGLWVFALLMSNVVTRLFGISPMMTGYETPLWIFNLLCGIGLLLSLSMVFAAGRLPVAQARLLDYGLVYMVLTALCIALVTRWDPVATRGGVSWVAFLIVMYPSIAPNTPLKVLLAGLLAASTDPLALWLASLRGVDIPISGYELTWMIVPNYIAALIAVIPARIYGTLGREVREARELGSYRLGDLLGRGGMGEVYRAEHRLLARPAAVKLIRPELLDRDRAGSVVERFRREAKAAASLRSPHTISLYDFGVAADGTCYYVMELLDGVDGESLVERFGPQPPERVAGIMLQACSSLAEAHALGMIHRDIKPSNIFVGRMGTELDFVKVLDFGLVTMRRRDPDAARLTAPNVIPGTPNAMAPEVAVGEAEPDARADVYALGCLAHWLLTGKPVFAGDTPVQIMLRHVRDQPEPPSAHSSFAETSRLDAIVLRCLEKNPADRPQDAAELRRLFGAVGFTTPWTEARAEAWWREHLGAPVEAGPCDRAELLVASSD